jgi:DNA-binding NtrC family response regulator
MRAEAIQTVAVFDASEDTVSMLEELLSLQGYRAVSGHADEVKSGQLDFINFLQTHKPAAIIWDIAPPYDRNWNFVQLIQALDAAIRCPLVLTTTHKKHLDELASKDTGAIEIVGKPYDLQLIVDAVDRAIQRRQSAGARVFGQSRE